MSAYKLDVCFFSDLPDSVSVFQSNAALNELADIQIMIDLIATRLVECRKLRLDAIISDEIKVLEVRKRDVFLSDCVKEDECLN